MGAQIISGKTTAQVSPCYGTDPAFRVKFDILAAAMPASGATSTIGTVDLCTFKYTGANTNMARLKRIKIISRTPTTTTTVPLTFQILRRLAVDTGTAASTPAAVPMDPVNLAGNSGASNAAALVVQSWNTTSAATTASAGLVLDEVTLSALTIGAAQEKEFIFSNAGDQAPVIRGASGLGGTAETIAISFSGGTATTAQVVSIMAEWEECPIGPVTSPDAG